MKDRSGPLEKAVVRRIRSKLVPIPRRTELRFWREVKAEFPGDWTMQWIHFVREWIEHRTRRLDDEERCLYTNHHLEDRRPRVWFPEGEPRDVRSP